MDVTRQSVSKWEGAQSIPDLDKIIRLSQLFGVSIDYLLKDEIENAEYTTPSDTVSTLKRVSMGEANAFLAVKVTTSKSIALAAFLCIVSPVFLLVLEAISNKPQYGITETIATSIGMIVLLVLVSIAVALFIASGMQTAPFGYLGKEMFQPEYGVTGMAAQRKAQYSPIYTRNIIIGASLCITSLVPLFGGIIFNAQNNLLLTILISVFFFMVGIGATFFIRSGIIWTSYEKLLQEGDYSKEYKENQPTSGIISTVYWLLATALYLGYSLSTNHWECSWIIWVVAGVLFPAVRMVSTLFPRMKF